MRTIRFAVAGTFVLLLAVAVFAVSGVFAQAAPTVTVSPTTVNPGGAITVTVANGPGHLADWVALTATTAPDLTYSAWAYLNGQTTPPAPGVTTATFSLVAPTTLGVYRVRFFGSGGWILLATGNNVTVQPPAATTATPNYVPKYDGSGNLIDSAVYESSGNVGIGSTSPGVPFEVKKTMAYQGSNVDGEIARLINPTDQANGAVMLSFLTDRNDASSTNYWTAAIKAIGTRGSGSSSYNSGQLRFYVNHGDGELWNPLVITSDGRVGIGPNTAAPEASLHVQGDIKVDGNIAAKYQDVAEWVKSRDQASPGTVVVIDEMDINVVKSSQLSYDTAVAGVVSAQPGITLGEKGAGKVLVAQSGRVRVKVDASYGAIRPGDLLVTSPTPGYAMRSQSVDVGGVQLHRPGTVLGKALGSLAAEQGEILVLVTLQ